MAPASTASVSSFLKFCLDVRFVQAELSVWTVVSIGLWSDPVSSTALQLLIYSVSSGVLRVKSSIDSVSLYFSRVIVPGSSSRSSFLVQIDSVTNNAPA